MHLGGVVGIVGNAIFGMVIHLVQNLDAPWYVIAPVAATAALLSLLGGLFVFCVLFYVIVYATSCIFWRTRLMYIPLDAPRYRRRHSKKRRRKRRKRAHRLHSRKSGQHEHQIPIDAKERKTSEFTPTAPSENMEPETPTKEEGDDTSECETQTQTQTQNHSPTQPTAHTRLPQTST